MPTELGQLGGSFGQCNVAHTFQAVARQVAKRCQARSDHKTRVVGRDIGQFTRIVPPTRVHYDVPEQRPLLSASLAEQPFD